MVEILGILCLIIPFILTLLNIINLFKKKKIKESLIDILTFVLGIGLTVFLYHIIGFKDYNEVLRLGGLEVDVHAPIASWSYPTVITIFLVGIVSYILIRVKKLNLPPLIIVISMSGILICSIYMVVFIIQLCKNINMHEMLICGIPYLMIFPINYILCSIRAEMEIIKYYKEKNLKSKEYNNRFKFFSL